MSEAANDRHYYSPNMKRGGTPAGCIMGNPYCPCKAGRRCLMLPGRKKEAK